MMGDIILCCEPLILVTFDSNDITADLPMNLYRHDCISAVLVVPE